MARYQYRYRKPQRRHFSIKWLLWTLLAAGILIYPFYEATTLHIDMHTVEVSNLPPNLKNLNIVYLSDIHQCGWFSQERVNNLIHTVNGLGADIVILGGDYASDSAGAIAFFHNAPILQARLGVYAVVGNHDRTEPENNLSLLVAAMKSAGCLPLVNQVSRIKVGQTYLYIAGVDDYSNGFPDVASVAAQVKADDFVIFAGHSPDLMKSVLAARSSDGDNHWFDLALFGHTHGGQISLFGYTPFSNLKLETTRRYIGGWFEENRAAVLVSNGVGTSVVPARLFAPPQIHLITLKAR
ncbi:MAG: metallophosphoesterase [Clostridia bacterium]